MSQTLDQDSDRYASDKDSDSYASDKDSDNYASDKDSDNYASDKDSDSDANFDGPSFWNEDHPDTHKYNILLERHLRWEPPSAWGPPCDPPIGSEAYHALKALSAVVNVYFNVYEDGWWFNGCTSHEAIAKYINNKIKSPADEFMENRMREENERVQRHCVVNGRTEFDYESDDPDFQCYDHPNTKKDMQAYMNDIVEMIVDWAWDILADESDMAELKKRVTSELRNELHVLHRSLPDLRKRGKATKSSVYIYERLFYDVPEVVFTEVFDYWS